MERYEGVCTGGPQKGQRMVHWAKTKSFYRPMIGLTLNIENAPVEAVEIGTYHLNDFGQWHWWPTAEGKAFDRLFGTADAVM